MSDYEEALLKKHAEILNRLYSERKRMNNPPATAEEMYSGIEESLKKSLGRDYERAEELASNFDKKKVRASGSPLGSRTPSPDKSMHETLKVIDVDDSGRRLEVRYNPERDQLTYAATVPDNKAYDKEAALSHSFDRHGPFTEKRQDIASLSLDSSDKVGFVRSDMRGAKEGAVDRLLLEALKDGRKPHSNSLLSAGKKMVAKKAVEMQKLDKPRYLDRLRNFIDTGKAGKIWSSAAPVLKPLGTGLTALGALGYSDMAGAAVDAAIPGGVEEAAVSDERAIKDPRYQEYIRKSMERGRK